jgi:hypothetical protein
LQLHQSQACLRSVRLPQRIISYIVRPAVVGSTVATSGLRASHWTGPITNTLKKIPNWAYVGAGVAGIAGVSVAASEMANNAAEYPNIMTEKDVNQHKKDLAAAGFYIVNMVNGYKKLVAAEAPDTVLELNNNLGKVLKTFTKQDLGKMENYIIQAQKMFIEKTGALKAIERHIKIIERQENLRENNSLIPPMPMRIPPMPMLTTMEGKVYKGREREELLRRLSNTQRRRRRRRSAVNNMTVPMSSPGLGNLLPYLQTYRTAAPMVVVPTNDSKI